MSGKNGLVSVLKVQNAFYNCFYELLFHSYLFLVLPYIQKPEENPSFSLYFTRGWQDSVLVSLHNLLATVFQCMPQPTLTSYESDATLVKKLQDEITALRGKVI